jgi:hypothetical protein
MGHRQDLRRISAFVLVATAVFALGGCDAETGSAGSQEVKEPKPNLPWTTVQGSGYSYAVPDGWGDPPQELPGFNPDTISTDLNDADAFADNVNTIVDTTVPNSMDLDELEPATVRAMESAGVFEDITVEHRTEVAGRPAAHFSSTSAIGGEHDIDSFYVTDGSRWIAVTLSTDGLGGDGRAELASKILAYWKWND